MAGEPEVAEVGVRSPSVRRDENVCRLHVAVDEARRLGGVERVCDLREQRERPLGLQRPSRGAARAGRPLRRTPSRGTGRPLPRRTSMIGTAFGCSRLAASATRAGTAGGTARPGQFADRAPSARRGPPRCPIFSEVDGAHRALADRRLDTKARKDHARANVGRHRSY